MSKRLTDTDIWEKLWYRKLSPLNKLIWKYLLDSCNFVGIWEVDFEAMQFYMNTKITPNKIDKEITKRIHVLDNSKRWFIPSFVGFQYGKLSDNNRVHKAVFSALKNKDLLEFVEAPSKGLTSPTLGLKDKDKEKDKEKDKDKEKVPFGSSGTVMLSLQEYETLGKQYGVNRRNEYINRVHDHMGSKRATYADHYLTIKAWMRKDKINPKVDTPEHIPQNTVIIKNCKECGDLFKTSTNLKRPWCPNCARDRS